MSTTTASSESLVGYVMRIARSSLGAKLVMGSTGLLFIGWLALHLGGNLALFAGPEKMNQYAHFLAGNPPLLWGQRIGLAVIVILHVLSGLRLAAINKAARPQPYAVKRWRKATFASRTMAAGGLFLLAFLIFHLAHFTWHWVYPEFANGVDAEKRHDVYKMVTQGLAVPGIAFIYVTAMVFLGLHLSHGFWSAFQSLGIQGRRWTPFATKAALAVAIGLAGGLAMLPIGVLFGLVK